MWAHCECTTLCHCIPLQQRLLQGRTCSLISVTHVVDAMACPAAKSAVVIPAVRKGLCNQRVRMVQDILLAHLFGAAAGIKSPTLIRAPCARLAGYTPILMWDAGPSER